MANEEHVRKLREGVEVWNRWREENPDVWPDLTEADLRGAHLREAHLLGAYLMGADLSEADLSRTVLNMASLSGANLSKALLNGAILMRTHLAGANLSEADLFSANLREVDLCKADLQGTKFGETVLTNINLAVVKNLESCRHIAPSTIDHRTLLKSGPLPLTFLRGCGLPDTLINYLSSLLNEPIQFYSCFISYSSKNHNFAERLHADLQGKGVRCWFAPENLKIGDRLRIGIDESIRIHDKLLLILSKQSIESDWVEQEVETALAKERVQKRTVLFPIRLDDAVMKIESGWPALVKNSRKIGDFREWKDHDAYQKAFSRLLRDLKEEDAKKGKVARA